MKNFNQHFVALTDVTTMVVFLKNFSLTLCFKHLETILGVNSFQVCLLLVSFMLFIILARKFHCNNQNVVNLYILLHYFKFLISSIEGTLNQICLKVAFCIFVKKRFFNTKRFLIFLIISALFYDIQRYLFYFQRRQMFLF